MSAAMQLAELYDSGNTAFQSLKRPATRADAARLVWQLRAWARELRAAATAYSTPLAASLRIVSPGPHEILCCNGARLLPGRNGRPSEAQRCTLVYTAAALHRLAPHLAQAKPERKRGPKGKNVERQIAKARELLRTGEATSRRQAAAMAVAELGAGDCNSDDAAVNYVRDKL